MPYEEISRKKYQSICACGKGFVQYYKIKMSNHFGEVKEHKTPIEIFCDNCKETYHYEERDYIEEYLVPNDMTFQKKEPKIDGKWLYNFEEKCVKKYCKEDINNILADMTAPKHRYIKNLTSTLALRFANDWYAEYGKKQLRPMVDFLNKLIKEYEHISTNIERKDELRKEYLKVTDTYCKDLNYVASNSYKLEFFEISDNENVMIKKDKTDNLTEIFYHPSLEKNLVNQYWDSFYIKECIDQHYQIEHTSLFKKYKKMVVKKYLGVCQICGNEKEILSSDMRIEHDDFKGYYPAVCCDCHLTSSFEAKTMDILNQLGLQYIREKSFEGLVGDSNKPLRFDFALYKNRDASGFPVIDLLIELQGPHHFESGFYDEDVFFITDNDVEVPSKVKNQERLLRQIRYDEMKKAYCSEHGIPLECIKYTVGNDYERLEKKIINILKTYGYKYYSEENGYS